MRFTLPVIWTRGGATRAGRLEALDDRLTLSSGDDAFMFPCESISGFVIERGPADRLRGLPVLRVRLTNGDVVRIASMGGAGSLHELATVIGGRQSAANGT